MRHTGVGALPLIPQQPSDSQTAPLIPNEQQMLSDSTRAVQALYDKLKRSQDSAAVVANLLSAPEHINRGGK